MALGCPRPLFGRQLWSETRIGCSQSARPEELKSRGGAPRVWFGGRSPPSSTLFQENIAASPPLLQEWSDEDPLANSTA